MLEFLFVFAACSVVYAYLGYPLLLWLIAIAKPRKQPPMSDGIEDLNVTILIPAHNEADVIREKLENTISLAYPMHRKQVVVVSDGSTDDTNNIVDSFSKCAIEFLPLTVRGGKAAALNAGLEQATGDIIVFSDASILLQAEALRKIIEPFKDPEIGCVSGEDHIAEGGGEGLYGKYELWLRSLESRVDSIVGASGCFYAQRRSTISQFPEGMAPDFFSVLKCVQKGFRAVSCPEAVGYMRATTSASAEFDRKVRTAIRGIAILWDHRAAMFMASRPLFSFSLFSHKLVRWLVPFFLVLMLIANVPLAVTSSKAWQLLLVAQILAYSGATAAHLQIMKTHEVVPMRILAFFVFSNLAILLAWLKFAAGERVEIWQPTQRTDSASS